MKILLHWIMDFTMKNSRKTAMLSYISHLATLSDNEKNESDGG